MSETANSVVIVGAGLAGAKTAEALRDRGFDAAITLIGQEPLPPYERPPLSKGYLQGHSDFAAAIVHPTPWYAGHGIDLRLDTRVTGLHRDNHEVELNGAERLGYGQLVLATGSTPRRLRLPGADAGAVHYLRTRADSDALRDTFGDGRRLVVIGGGWIGLEAAAAARAAGTAVTVVESAPLPLLAVLGPDIAQVFAALHREHGVELRLSASTVEIITAEGRATGVRLGDGETLAADAVLVGIGAAPDTALAQAAGLQVDNGVLVDAALHSSDPDIYAVGDIANQLHPTLGVRVRVEHWAAALNQPAAAAAAIMGEGGAGYTALPYFFSDQYDLGMEYLGHAPVPAASQLVVRGDLHTREFVAFWLDAGNRIMAVMNVNVWDVVDAVRPLLVEGRVVQPQQLADPSVPYDELG